MLIHTLAPEISEEGVQGDIELEAPNLGDNGLAGMFWVA